MDIDKKDGVLNGYYSKALPDDDLPEGCYRFSNKHGLWAMINGYEEYAREILSADGYPLTTKELWAMRKGLPKRIRDILDMFFLFERVRSEVEKNDAKMSAWWMAHAIHSAMRARVRPVEPDIYRGRKTIRAASKGGKTKKQISNDRHQVWQNDADEIWAKHPSYSVWRVAGMLEGKYNGDIELHAKRDTIARTITK